MAWEEGKQEEKKALVSHNSDKTEKGA